jgi:nucleotide sugar dehydrogenase
MNKNISIIGVGKLGLCLGLNLEKIGYNVLGIDKCETYIEDLNKKSFKSPEPFVNGMLQSSKNISFTSSIEKSLENDLIFIVVATPSTQDWRYDHTQIDDVIDKLISFGYQEKRKDIIINCTTFPGYCDELQKKINKFNFFVSYNPEFIAQGSIIQDQQNCDMVLIGEYDEYIGNRLEKIYSEMCVNTPIFNRMSIIESEITKLSINCFLTTKISYANMIGDIVSRHNGNPDVVLNAIGSDSRIGNKCRVI